MNADTTRGLIVFRQSVYWGLIILSTLVMLLSSVLVMTHHTVLGVYCLIANILGFWLAEVEVRGFHPKYNVILFIIVGFLVAPILQTISPVLTLIAFLLYALASTVSQWNLS